jgi:hypothetical protein
MGSLNQQPNESAVSVGQNLSTVNPTSNENLSLSMIEGLNMEDNFDTAVPHESQSPKTNSTASLFNMSNRKENVETKSPKECLDSASSLPMDKIVFTEVPEVPSPIEKQLSVSSSAASASSYPAQCNCQSHLKHKVLDQSVLNVTVQQFFNIQFGSEGKELMKAIYRQRGSQSYQHVDWQLGTREVVYDVPFKAPMLPASTTKCIEKQSIVRDDAL